MSNKKIEINPALFSISKSTKTKKNREKKTKPITTPLISPNVLKNKLLKRIKEYKNKETENLENNTKKLQQNVMTDKINISNNNYKTNELTTYTDEFNESIEYLQSLSQLKKNNENNIYKEKEKIRNDFNQKTLRKPINHLGSVSNQIVNLELPDELKEPLISVNTEQLQINSQPIKLNIVKDNIPYGVLKGGLKPTFREWNKTQKKHVDNPNQALVVNTEIPLNNPDIEREYRLNMLKEKIKHKKLINQNLVIPKPINNEKTTQQNIFNSELDNLVMTKKLINKPTITEDFGVLEPESQNQEPSQSMVNNLQSNNLQFNVPQSNNNYLTKDNLFSEVTNNTNINVEQKKYGGIKRIIKRTVHKKYTLGKSKIQKTVAVLLKDNKTRKKVLQACKDLKKKPISEVKKYLREHNLIKIGSNAPTDVIRKLYESAMLAGEVTNNNKDTLLHNFIKNEENVTI